MYFVAMLIKRMPAEQKHQRHFSFIRSSLIAYFCIICIKLHRLGHIIIILAICCYRGQNLGLDIFIANLFISSTWLKFPTLATDNKLSVLLDMS